MDGVVEVVATRGSDFDVFLFRYGDGFGRGFDKSYDECGAVVW